MKILKTSPRNHVLWLRSLLLMVIVGMMSPIVWAKTYYPIIQLDFGAEHDAAHTQTDFTPFTILDSGTAVSGITVTLESTGSGLDSRWRWAPTGVPYENIYRDFIFAKGSMRMTLSGLQPGMEYQLTLYSYDTASSAGGPRWTDWTNAATGDLVVTAGFDASIAPTAEDSDAYSGLVSADANGVITLDAGPNENTAEQAGLSNPYCFINALVLSTDTPIVKAHEPIPEDGATVATSAVALSWQYGQTSVSDNVYFGESYEDVNNATTADTDIFRGNILVKPFLVGSPNNIYPDGLTPGKTYYWRIDEVDANDIAFKGDVWSFTVASPTAYNPDPVDGSRYIDPNIMLIWTAGAGSIIHHVYFGDNLADVTAGNGNTDKGVVEDANYYPGLLDPNTTYYWRIDESDGSQTHTGEIWSFTTTPDGLGMIPMDMWTGLSTTDSTLPVLFSDPRYPGLPDSTTMLTSFDSGSDIGDGYGARIYGWLYVPISGDYTFYFTSAGQGQLLLSPDDSPQNAQVLLSEPTWGNYGVFSIKSDTIPLLSGSKYYIEAEWKDFGAWDHCQVAWEGPGIHGISVINGSFLSPFLPVTSYNAYPQNDSNNIAINTVLSWTSGIHADLHHLYLGTDFNDINDVNEANLVNDPNIIFVDVTENSYDPNLLDPNTTYFWRVDDINSTLPMLWKGRPWSFTTGDYYMIEDFEEYNNDSPNLPYQTWLDGLGYLADNFFPNDYPGNGTGSIVGHDIWSVNSPYYQGNIMDVNITLTGSHQSMPVYYNDSNGVSEIERTWPTPQDWTVKGLDALVLNIYGDPNNSAAPPYVTLIDQNGSQATVTFENNTLLQSAVWQRWEIPLSEFTGVDPSQVKKMIIGVANQTGGSGVFYLDNILLTLSRNEPNTPKIVYVDATEGAAGNTAFATGGVFNSTTDGSGSDNLWRGRAFGNGATIFEAGGAYGTTANPEDCPRLVTTVDVPEGSYQVFAYFWSDGSPWRLRASLTDEAELPLLIAGDPNSPATVANVDDFAVPVPLLSEGNRTLWQVPLGSTGPTTTLSVYIDDDANHQDGNARTWYDGIGYQSSL